MIAQVHEVRSWQPPPESTALVGRQGACKITFSAFIATMNIPEFNIVKGRRYWLSDQTTDDIQAGTADEGG